MRYEEHVDAVERESAAIDAALRAGPMTDTVPTCPEWTVADLTRHLGEFYGWWAHNMCDGTGRPKTPAPDPPADDGLADWCRDQGRHLVSELRATPPDTEVWTWAPEKRATFIARRCANELAVHRVDAQSARGTPDPIDGDLAVDGIDEIFVMVESLPLDPPDSTTTIHLHATDREAEWLLTLSPEGLGVRREHAKGDLALRGAVSDLELILYGRTPLADVERFGDEAALDTWYRFFHFG